MIELIINLSNWAIPGIILSILLIGYFRDVDIYDTFTEGAIEGITVGGKIVPYLVAMFMAIRILEASGTLAIMLNWLEPFLTKIGVPVEIAPLSLLRPLSGTGSLAFVEELINNYGPDSFIGRVASTLQGSTETTFYVATVYFGAVEIERQRHSILAGIAADLAGFAAAVFICQLVFNY